MMMMGDCLQVATGSRLGDSEKCERNLIFFECAFEMLGGRWSGGGGEAAATCLW